MRSVARRLESYDSARKEARAARKSETRNGPVGFEWSKRWKKEKRGRDGRVARGRRKKYKTVAGEGKGLAAMCNFVVGRACVLCHGQPGGEDVKCGRIARWERWIEEKRGRAWEGGVTGVEKN